jgi:phage repressor protein C with HTH and peptisase S24 domain
MNDVRELIEKKLRERGLSMKDASVKIEKNAAYIQQFIKRKVPEKLPEDVREALAPLLGLSPDELRENASTQSSVNRLPIIRLPAADPADKVPVMGIGEGGKDGWSLWNGEIVDYVQRPPSLANAPSGYAAYVVGASMEPRYHPGELIFMHPGKPVTPGCYVMVQLKAKAEGEPPPALVKRLGKKTGIKYVLEQFNPPRTFDIQTTDVVSIHRIVGSGE